MSVKRVEPKEAAELLEQGWIYLDVRSEPEFAAGHPAGAYNVPLMHAGPGGMRPNPDFARVVEASFPTDTKLVVGCKSGGRSLRAAEMLLGSGFSDIVDMRGGFDGERTPTGQVRVPGWKANQLPVSSSPEPGRSYSELQEK